MLPEATANLVAKARDESCAESELNAAAQSFFTALSSASAPEVQTALAEIGRHFDLPRAERGIFLAMLCGAAIEQGVDPTALEQPLIDRLTALLTPAVELARAFRADVSPIDSAALEQESAEEEDEESDEQEDDSVEQFEHWRAGTAGELPDENLAWEVLQQFWMPAIALFSASARARASAQHVRPLAGEIAELHEAGHWLAMILGVLNEEPILVIEPDTELGIVGSISGVVDNFQLQVLLMDGFPKRGLLAGRRVSKKVRAEIARGDGPQQGSATVTGSWNMYTWQALEPDLTLPSDQSSCDHWIWNEGAPEDIPVFEGYRVVLLGPASYPRMWQAQRMFAALRANLAIDRELSPEETRSWLQKMGAAGRSD